MLSVVKGAWPAPRTVRIHLAKKQFCRFYRTNNFKRLAKRFFGFGDLSAWTLGTLLASPDF